MGSLQTRRGLCCQQRLWSKCAGGRFDAERVPCYLIRSREGIGPGDIPPCACSPEHQQLPWLLQAQKQSFQELQMSPKGARHLDLAP